MKPRLLDLFCCAGGAGKGYADAGFDVVGVDLEPQSEYPFEFHQADALAYLAEHGASFDAIHASPPCHDHSSLSSFVEKDGTGDLLALTREALSATGLPYVIENVVGAPMVAPLMLCGTEFGLQADGWWLARHRLSACNPSLWGAGGCHCWGRKVAGVYGHSDGPIYKTGRKGWSAPSTLARQLLRDAVDHEAAQPRAGDPARVHRVHRRAATRCSRSGGRRMTAGTAEKGC